jgi:hypothetical protein
MKKSNPVVVFLLLMLIGGAGLVINRLYQNDQANVRFLEGQ